MAGFEVIIEVTRDLRADQPVKGCRPHTSILLLIEHFVLI